MLSSLLLLQVMMVCTVWTLLASVQATNSGGSVDHLHNRAFYSTSLRRHSSKQHKLSSSSSSSTRTTSRCCNTQIRFQFPTCDRVARWFGADQPQSIMNPNNEYQDTTCFNHNLVGMTNPCLHIAVPARSLSTVHRQEHVIQEVLSSSTWTTGSNNNNNNNLQAEWWPQSMHSPGEDTNHHPRDSWRVLRFRQRMPGRGAHIYEAVRDAALSWDFGDYQQGIVSVQQQKRSTTTRNQDQQQRHYRERHQVYGTGFEVVHTASYGDGDLYEPAGSNVWTMWSDGGRPRRLVTYTRVWGHGRKNNKNGLYIVNPVQIVYNVLDQKSPSSSSATTYSATAFSTLKGHWMRGEERVTVAHREETGCVDVEILSQSGPAPSLVGKLVWPVIGKRQRRFFRAQMNALQRVAAEAADAAATSTMNSATWQRQFHPVETAGRKVLTANDAFVGSDGNQ